MPSYLIDTNVLLAASAWHDARSGVQRAMPHEAALREHEYEWLAAFAASDDRLVLDESFLILDEYHRNMPFNRQLHHPEYGLMVLQQKQDRGLVDYVPIEVQDANGEKIGVLPAELAAIVTDREDRKWIAAALAANILLSEPCAIVYGADSDWHLIEDSLLPFGITFIRLLPEAWYIAREL